MLCPDATAARDGLYAAPVVGPRRALAPSAGHRGLNPDPSTEGGTLDSVAAVNWPAYEEEALGAIGAAGSEAELDEARVRFLGRKSELVQALRGVRDRESGMRLNGIRTRLEASTDARGRELADAELDRRL